MRRKTDLIIDNLEDSIYLLEMDGFHLISSHIREALNEINILEKEIESLKIENQNLRDIISSNS